MALSYAGKRGFNSSLDALYAEILLNIGELYNRRDDVIQDSALYFLLEAEKNVKYLNPVYKVELYNLIGDFFSDKKEPQLALPYYKKAYALSGDASGESWNIVMNNLALGFIRVKELDSALYYLTLYEKEIARTQDAHQYLTYYDTRARYEAAKGDSCSVGVIGNRYKALTYAVKLKDMEMTEAFLIDLLKCIRYKPQGNKVISGIALSVLGYCSDFYEQLRMKEKLSSYATFLEGYAYLEFTYGNKERSVQLYKELVEVLNRMNNEDYLKGVDEAVIKYKSELKDKEISLLREQERTAIFRNRLIIGGLTLLFIISVLVFVLYRQENRNRRVLNERNHKVEQLLREVHHRVKNNLQIVSSFINIQFDRIRDKEASQTLRDASARIVALARLHQLLYRQSDFSKIQLKEYIQELGTATVETLDEKVKIRFDMEEQQVDIDQAIQVGLAVTELITNAIKHAFANGTKGSIFVSLHHTGDACRLTIQDDGIGLPDDMQPDNLQSIGMRLIKDIAERQLNGTFSCYN
jgi:two-component sensor histidine kinase